MLSIISYLLTNTNKNNKISILILREKRGCINNEKFFTFYWNNGISIWNKIYI